MSGINIFKTNAKQSSLGQVPPNLLAYLNYGTKLLNSTTL